MWRSRLWQAIVGEAAHTPLAAAIHYMQTKRDHLGSHEACDAQGIRFQTMVCKTSGAWAAEALEVLQLICKALLPPHRHPAQPDPPGHARWMRCCHIQGERTRPF